MRWVWGVGGRNRNIRIWDAWEGVCMSHLISLLDIQVKAREGS